MHTMEVRDLRTKTVVVVPYDNQWKSEFTKIKNILINKLGNCIITIEHVGSTSVEGLSAKPIIDIDIVIENYDIFDEVKTKLAGLGYDHEGDLGMKDREAFAYNNKPELMTHHLYVCPKYSNELKRHIIFRDYLRTHSDDRDLYSKVKLESAKLYPKDIDRYIMAKSPCIETIYRKCGLLAI